MSGCEKLFNQILYRLSQQLKSFFPLSERNCSEVRLEVRNYSVRIEIQYLEKKLDGLLLDIGIEELALFFDPLP